MATDLILVLDAGTGGGRVIAVDKDGVVRARSYRAWGYFEPPEAEFYGKEFRPQEFQKIMAECCREVLSSVDADSVKGVATTGMRQGCVFLDKEENPIFACPNRDVRGILYSDEVEEIFGEDRAYSITGHWPPWMFVPARILWFRNEQPRIAEKIAKVLMINDWLIHWLSGKAVSEQTNAAESLLFDINHRAWSKPLLDALQISQETMPELMPCGSVAGEVKKDVAEITGIPEGCPVITGMADTQAALMAGAVIEPGQAGIVAGSTAPVMMVMDEARFDPDKRLWIGCHPLAGRWVAESNSGDAGLIYRGFVEGYLGALAGADASPYEAAEKWAGELPPGAMGARSFMGPVIWDLKNMSPQARAGVFFTYPPGDENAGPGNVCRAILENIAFALRANLEQAIVLAGEPTRVVIAGGMTRSRLFCEIVANVIDRQLEVVEEPEATAVGCAMAGFSALGYYPDLKQAVQSMKADSSMIEPDEDDVDDYNDYYEDWCEEYAVMMGLGDD